MDRTQWTGFWRDHGPDAGAGGGVLWQRARQMLRQAARGRLALFILGAAACSELAQSSQAALPPATQPPYVTLTAKYLLAALKDRSNYSGFAISGLRWSIS